MTPPDRPHPRIGETIAAMRRQFARAGIETAALEARLLAGGILGLTDAQLLSRGEDELDPESIKRLAAAERERLSGKPVHRILGSREFYGLSLLLSEETLEPRPDTETLVDAAIPIVNGMVGRNGTCAVVDLGAGTGAIGLAILAHCPGARCTGVDLSAGAAATANRNAERLGLSDRYRCVTGNWLDPVEGMPDVIVSNPPYIETRVIDTLAREVRDYDPRLALDGGDDGLDAYRRIAAQAGTRLRPGGAVLVEIGAGQGDAVAALFEAEGLRIDGRRRDLGAIERVLIFGKP